ncbi:heme lyase NrfEFG subunit NrfE [Pokkaliibacter plantistimulans]|uniref:Heme lyase NrfEFG subunit NrfE n=1 Tax=Proteobacteria bacterium 228 TaxID=2083153 RepID=A0A2S5KU44_9PROT|nr:heme lyase CcmF/NrfE family subunit [Pokkaliibacter plantistimulans]PPC78381.1 heme lyase NrfEFG subunit NrfE [Pokkaliibacter plantistimulans]
MIPELGQLALILALCLALMLALVPLWGAYRGNLFWMRFATPLATGQFFFVALAFGFLTYAFMTNDFTVAYVATNSNSHLPWYYKFSAVWGGHEGSLLLWLFILCLWTVAVAWRSLHLPPELRSRVLSVMGMISTGFLLFVLLTSSPFARLFFNAPDDGQDLNPLLQDFGLIVHPPMLYMGYVGFSVAFAFAIAALLGGRLDAAWARWARPWTNAAWAFLSIGIVLGSWWAYYELGWGGWWFWDPVENASFMPWLAGTALIHSMAVTEKRGEFKSWTVLLAICAFSLSLLGTFLVRSGVLTSVHAFASDPTRGFFVLMLLAVTIGGSLLLFALRAVDLKSESTFNLLSKETWLLINNLILLVAMVVVLLGTLYPLVVDALQLGKLSVGPPYFNMLFVPLMGLLALALGSGLMLRWKRHARDQWLKSLAFPALAVLIFATVAVIWGGEHRWGIVLGVVMAGWIAASTLVDVARRIRFSQQGWRQPRSYWGMHVAHLGFCASILGVTWVSLHAFEQDIRVEPGHVEHIDGYDISYLGATSLQGPNYTAEQGHFVVSKQGKTITELFPQKRNYSVQRSMMTEAAIDPGLMQDIYIAMGERLDGDAWAVRIHIKPMVRWIWLGGLLMAFGGALAATDLRYRRLRNRQSQVSVGSETAPVTEVSHA